MGKDVFVDVEQSINTAIRKVRIALCDDAEQPRYLQTVVGRGYRFIAQLIIESDDGDPSTRLFTAEELGQAVLSAAGLAPEQIAPPLKPRAKHSNVQKLSDRTTARLTLALVTGEGRLSAGRTPGSIF